MLAAPSSLVIAPRTGTSVLVPYDIAPRLIAGGIGILLSLGLGFGGRLYWPQAHTTRVRNQDVSLAIYDSLTGLPSRRLFLVLLSQALTRAESTGRVVAILAIALEHFRPMPTSTAVPNKALVVRVQAARIKSALQSHDAVARLDARTFAVIIDNLDSPDRVIPLAQKIQSTMSLPLLVEGQELLLSCRIGGTLAPFDGTDAETLLDAACQILSSRQGYDASIVFLSDPATGSPNPHAPFGSVISSPEPHHTSRTITR